MLAFILVLFSGTRFFPEQQDYSSYKESLDAIINYGHDYSGYYEPGYVLLTRVFSFFTGDSYVSIGLIALTGVSLVFASICRLKSIYLFLPVALYFSHGLIMREMGAIRSGLAAGICLFSFIYIERKELWRWVLCLVIAISFHLSAVAFILMYPICKFNWNKKGLWIVLAICTLIGFLFPLGRLLASLPLIGQLSRISGYAQDIDGALGILNNPNTLKQLVIVIIGIYYFDVLIKKVPYYRILLIGSLLSACWLMCWNDFPIVAGRFAMYFSLGEIILLPSYLLVLTKKSRMIGALLIIALAFMQLYLNHISHLTPESGYYPYRSILFL